ncbi:MAG: CvpA family protein [Clostridia bacterium]|nr:CvpA family protein [Clostridia bacterium]
MFYINGLCAANWTNYLVDVLVLVGIGVLTYLCAKRGFIDCFLSFVSIIAAFVVAALFSKLFISATGGLFGLQDAMTGTFETALKGIEGFNLDISNEGIAATLAEKNLPAFLVDLVIENFGNTEIAVGTTLAMLVGQTFSRLLISLIAFVVLFFAVRFAMFLLKKILTALAAKIVLIGKVNMLLGALVGLIEGLLILSAVLGVLALIPVPAITAYMNDCLLVGWLYNNNIINMILGWIIS